MPHDIISTDPTVAQSIYLEIDGENVALSGVSGLGIEHDVAPIAQASPVDHTAPHLTISRAAPSDAQADPIWTWFIAIRDRGLAMDGASARKDGSIVLRNGSFTEIGRFDFVAGWPSKIVTDAVGPDSDEAVRESITLVVERLSRVP